MKRLTIILTTFCLGAASALGAEVVPTRVKVRAVSRDAKVIGSGVGGAHITIREASTGKLLAEGGQHGGTGDTQKIMIEPRARGAVVYDTSGAAAFVATLMLERPTVVKISASGPLGSPHSIQETSKTLLLVPGRDVMGEGVLLEIHGFTVSLLSPDQDAGITAGEMLEVRATVRMT